MPASTIDRSLQSICDVCVMDDTDRDIVFYGPDGCNHCLSAKQKLSHDTFTGADGERRRQRLIAKLKDHGRGRDYDCILGVSGGVDSSYLALLARKSGLRVLAVHVDSGWNSDLAVRNIETLVSKLGIDLYTHVNDWQEIRDLQRAFFRASVIDIEMVNDHPNISAVYAAADKHDLKFVLSGSNVATEAILPKSWANDKRDAWNIKAIHAAFGERPIRKYPFMGPAKLAYYTFAKRITFVPLLNYTSYSREQAIATLSREIGWLPYPRKHGEGRFTKFYQEYVLPRKFGVDKRKAHLSSMIAAGLMSREAALSDLNQPLYRPDELEEDREFVLKKLGFSENEFEAIMTMPMRSHQEYRNSAWVLSNQNPVYGWVRRTTKARRFDLPVPTGKST